MERRASRVSEVQWNILLNFLERNPNLARARGYNNSARGRAESLRLWQEVATLLNSEGSGTTKSPKEWSVYVSNYKSKLKKIVADLNTDASATGGGPPQASVNLSEIDNRFLSLLGPGFGQTAPRVMVQPFPDEQPSISLGGSESQVVILEAEDISQNQQDITVEQVPIEDLLQPKEHIDIPAQDTTPTPTLPEVEPLLPRRSRQRRQRTRPLAPLDEARRILSQVEMQRAAADAANARAHQQIANNLQPLENISHNLGRIADNLQSFEIMAHHFGRLVDVAERYVNYITSQRPTLQ